MNESTNERINESVKKTKQNKANIQVNGKKENRGVNASMNKCTNQSKRDRTIFRICCALAGAHGVQKVCMPQCAFEMEKKKQKGEQKNRKNLRKTK